MHRCASALAILLVAASCQAARPSRCIPFDEDWIVAVKSARIPDFHPRISRRAQHSWLDLKMGDENSWRRVEVLSRQSGVATGAFPAREARRDLRWRDRRVTVQRVYTGPEAERIAHEALQLAPRSHALFREGYLPWPGPNSNTFIASLARDIDGLEIPFDHSAIGKDYLGLIGIAPTHHGPGLRVETPLVGVALGLEQGVELHLLGGTLLGLTFWPPRILLPFMPPIGLSDV